MGYAPRPQPGHVLTPANSGFVPEIFLDIASVNVSLSEGFVSVPHLAHLNLPSHGVIMEPHTEQNIDMSEYGDHK